jgi:hypothetical protein
MPTDPILDSYAAWKHCITVECRIPLTRAFVEQRLAVWQNPKLEETQRFRRCYGDAHWQRVAGWFQQSLAELNQTSASP